MARNNKSEYRTWELIRATFEGARPYKTAAEVWIVSECQSLPTRTRNSLKTLGVKFSGDLQYCTAAELKRQGGISVGGVEGLRSMCQAWGVGLLGCMAGPPQPFAADIAAALLTPESVNHPAHYMPGPYEVYKVLAHFNIMHGFVQQAIIYLARAHRKGSYQQDVAKAAKWIELTFETGAGMGDYLNRPNRLMDNLTLREVALHHWGVSEQIAEVIKILGSPWTDPPSQQEVSEGRIGENLTHYVPRLWRAWRQLTEAK